MKEEIKISKLILITILLVFSISKIYSQSFSTSTFKDSIENYDHLNLKNKIFNLKLEQIIASKKNDTEKLNILNQKLILSSERMIALDKADGGIYYNIGRSYYSLGDYQNAVPTFTKGLSFSDMKFKNFEYRAYSKFELKDFRGAISDLKNCLQLAQDDIEKGEVHYYIGLCYLNLSKYSLALDNYSAAIKSNPENGVYYYYRGITYLQSGSTDAGCSDLSKAGNYGFSEAYDIIKDYCNN